NARVREPAIRCLSSLGRSPLASSRRRLRINSGGRSLVTGSTISSSDQARAAILARIREARKAAAPAEPPAAGVRGPLPEIEADLVARFCARAESMQATTARVAQLSDVP